MVSPCARPRKHDLVGKKVVPMAPRSMGGAPGDSDDTKVLRVALLRVRGTKRAPRCETARRLALA